ncbi:glycosyltransferase [Paenibacillus sp. 1P07SE]|uniref:CgeB family protein n=1 Tax=Paenibacillus sp. 1P07SE TaxID=3132209 RepID=UPI0039A77745
MHINETAGPGSPSIAEAAAAGKDAGFRKGREDGYRFGQLQGGLAGIVSPSLPVRDIHVVYVTAGIGVPYPALDAAVIDALRGLARKVTVASPSDDVAGLAGKQRPDLVVVLNGVVFPAEQVEKLRNHGIRTAVWFTDDPYYTDWTSAIGPRYDYIFTLEHSCVAYYESLGCRQVHYLPFAAAPSLFHPKHVPQSYQSDICFIGTGFWNRIDLIDRLTPYLKHRKVVIAGWWWDRLKHYDQLSGSIRLGDWMTPEDTASYYNGAKIVINLHRSVDDDTINANRIKLPASSPNPRTFEIAACGALQLTDLRADLGNWYKVDEEIAHFSSFEELTAKLDYYLTHDEERRRLALRGLLRTRSHHTYEQRLHTLLERIFPGGAPI